MICRIPTSLKLAVLLGLASLTARFALANEIPAAVPEDVGMSSERLDRVTTAVQKSIDAGKVQGAVVAIARRGKVVYFEALGLMDVEQKRPMTKDAIFHMASSTKPLLGVATMMMIEEGLIRATDPVEKYIPEFKGIQVAVLKEPADEDISPIYVPGGKVPAHRLVAASRLVTIQDLLTHTSGLATNGLGSAVADLTWDNETLATWIPKVGAGPLDFQPGSRWAYSGGVGLDVVARIIEIVSGTPFNIFLQERIFEPLGMTDSYHNVPNDKQSRQVILKGDKRRGPREPTQYYSASYGLMSTARDYLNFEQMLVNGGTLFGNRLLGPRSVAWMSSNQVGGLFREKGDTNGLGFGYTVAIVLDPIAARSPRSEGSFGWIGAAGTTSWTDPKEELTAVIMAHPMSYDLHYGVANAIRQALID